MFEPRDSITCNEYIGIIEDGIAEIESDREVTGKRDTFEPMETMKLHAMVSAGETIGFLDREQSINYFDRLVNLTDEKALY